MSVASGSIPRISFCSTCTNRLWQLRQTLPKNLRAVRADGAAEIVLVNYGSRDGLHRWIRRYEADIRAGRLIYVHRRNERYFHAPKAKNLAHFAATGDYVVNLDCDNLIGVALPAYRRAWQRDPDVVLHGFSGTHRDGSYGRIALRRRMFDALGGYDEGMLGMYYQDRDLLLRARALGHRIRRVRPAGPRAVQNSFRQKTKHLAPPYTDFEMRCLNAYRSDERIARGWLVANRRRARVPVTVNFHQPRRY